MTIKFMGKRKGTNQTVKVSEPFTFPAGEAHIKGFDTLNVDDYEYFIADIRGHNPQDLFHLAMWVNGLDSFGQVEDYNYPIKYVILPYLPGARADRGIPFGAKVYADFFNGLFINCIIVVDPHSPVAPALYENSELFMSKNVTEYPFERIIKDRIAHPNGDEQQMDHPYVGVIAPDHGARDRAERAAAVLHVPVYTAGKARDFDTGQLTGFHMEDTLPKTGRFLLVDDILDGMGTFLGLGAAIKETNPNVELDLWGTHGVFSNEVNLKKASDLYGIIHTTDSYATVDSANGSVGRLVEDGKLVIHSVTPYLYAQVSNLHAISM